VLLNVVKILKPYLLNVSSVPASQPGECNSYYEAVHMSRKVNTDVLRQDKSISRLSSVTLVIQLDSGRLERLVTLVGLWKGISYITFIILCMCC